MREQGEEGAAGSRPRWRAWGRTAGWLVLWTLLVCYPNPFVFFRNFSGANTQVELPYSLYVFSGLVLWSYFLDAATASAGAVRLDAALLTKVYYPRLLTPLVPCTGESAAS